MTASTVSRPSTSRTAAATVFALFAFAGNSLLCRLALRDAAMDPVAFTSIRILAGALALAPLLPALWLKRGAGSAPDWASKTAAVARGPMAWLRPSVWLGPVTLFVYALGFSLAYVSLDAGTGALLLFGSVQLTMLLVGWLGGDRPTPRGLAGILLALSGVVWLVLPGVSAPPPRAAFLMLLAGLAWGGYSLVGKAFAGRDGGVRPSVATARNFALAAPLALLAALLAVPAGQIECLPLNGTLLAVAAGALTSGLGYVVWYAALTGLSASTAAVVQLTVPVLAALAGVVLLDEPFSMRLVGAGTMTLGGVAVAIAAAAAASRPQRES
ncbi:MAG: DMT family transporter [Planctomycetota bacterium]